MSIPQLKSCCCCFSLRTGSLVVGWLSLIGAVVTLATAGLGLAGVQDLEDKVLAIPKLVRNARQQAFLDQVPALKAVVIFLIICGILKSLITIMLLKGVYQNKAKLIFYWVVIALTLACVEEVFYIIQAIAFSEYSKYWTLLAFLVQLYFIVVVHSFYKDIRDKPVSA